MSVIWDFIRFTVTAWNLMSITKKCTRELWLHELFMTTVETEKIPRGSPSIPRIFRSQLRFTLYVIYTRKIRSQALTCFMVVERRANKSLPCCLQSVAVTPGRSPPSFQPYFRGCTSIYGSCIFPRTGCNRHIVRFRYMCISKMHFLKDVQTAVKTRNCLTSSKLFIRIEKFDIQKLPSQIKEGAWKLKISAIFR